MCFFLHLRPSPILLLSYFNFKLDRFTALLMCGFKLAQKSFASPEKMLYFKNGWHKNDSLCMAICVGVLALIWYLICNKWMWNNKFMDIWLTWGHIRKVALKSCPIQIAGESLMQHTVAMKLAGVNTCSFHWSARFLKSPAISIHISHHYWFSWSFCF